MGAAATTMLAACGPFVTLDDQPDTAADTDTDTDDSSEFITDSTPSNPSDPSNPTDPTTGAECYDSSECNYGYSCIDNVCVYDDYYCGTGGCCDDGCCYGECYYYECYSDADCGPQEVCSGGYGGYCQYPEVLVDCGVMPEVALLELPPASQDVFVSLAFVDANGDAAQDLVVGRSANAELHLGPGDAPPIALPVPPDASVIDAVSGDFDGDGDADLVVSTAQGRLLLLAADGAGGFALAQDQDVGSAFLDLVALQWNGDGALDVAGVSAQGQAGLHLGSGSGSFVGFEDLPTFDAVVSIAGTDYGGDAYGDLWAQDSEAGQLFLGDFSGDLTLDEVLPGNMHGERRVLSGPIDQANAHEVVGYTPKPDWLLLELWIDGVAGPLLYALDGAGSLAGMGDIDGDGVRDVVVGGDSTIRYVRGTTDPGYASFACQSTYFVGTPFETLAVGDFDGNGRADVAIESLGSVSVLRSQ
jgi:hypothetical protein